MRSFLLASLVALSIGACSQEHELKLSPHFGVCLNDGSDSYTYALEGGMTTDRDDGRLSNQAGEIEVYVGRHPDITRKNM